jgi:serine-type D-Ala-D-Ala carboxypeptidase (penicillin-binding protein 5/6)
LQSVVTLRQYLRVLEKFLFICWCSLSALSAPAFATSQPILTSPQWALQHWRTGIAPLSLAKQAADVPTHPASITKLLTAYVTLQAVANRELALDTVLTISAVAIAQDGTRVGYQTGERVAVQDALQGMLAISGNDAAWALGEGVAGTMDGFVARMNAVSTTIGLKNSQWRNPHGLTQAGHTSTAADLALLAHALWHDFPIVRPWLGVKTYTWNGVAQSNRNSLLWRDATVDGFKTGHTDAAGYNLAASSHWRVMVEQDVYDWRLTSVVLGAASAAARATDSAALLAWGRSAYKPWRLYSQGAALGKVSLAGTVGDISAAAPSAIWAVLPAEQTVSALRYELLPLASVQAPVAAGAVIATWNVYDGQTLLATSPAVTLQAIDRAPWHKRLWQWVKSLF